MRAEGRGGGSLGLLFTHQLVWPPAVAAATGCTHTVAPGEKLRGCEEMRDERWSQGRGKKKKKKVDKYKIKRGRNTHKNMFLKTFVCRKEESNTEREGRYQRNKRQHPGCFFQRSSSTQLSAFAAFDALSDSKPCRQASICRAGSCPELLRGAKMVSGRTDIERFYFICFQNQVWGRKEKVLFHDVKRLKRGQIG